MGGGRISIIKIRTLCNECGAEFPLEADTEEFDSPPSENELVVPMCDVFCQACIDAKAKIGTWAWTTCTGCGENLHWQVTKDDIIDGEVSLPEDRACARCWHEKEMHVTRDWGR